MMSLKVLSTAAAIALVLPMTAPSESFAQNPHGGKGNFAMRGGGGAPAARFSGGGGGARFSGGGGGAPMARFSGVRTGGAPVARYGGTGTTVTRYSGGGWNGGYRYRRGGGGFIPGAVAGAVIGGALTSSYAYYGGPDYDSSYAYYGGPDYYASGYYPGYDDNGYGYYDDAAVVAAAPAPVGDDAVAYCMQTYQSYDPASGTYLGYDGLRHPCP